MPYAIQIVGNDELPQGVHRVIVEREDGPPIMLINGEAAQRVLRAV